MPTGRIFMETKIISPAVAQVIGVFRGKSGGFEPLGPDTPLTADEVCRNPVFYILDLNSDTSSENLIIDVIYDNLSPLRLQDLRRGTDIPHGVRFWPDWFDIPPYEEMHDIDGRLVYPRAPGLHTVQIRTGGGSLRRWDGSGTSARRMAGIPARCLRYGSEGTTVFENEMLTRCAISGTGVVLGLIGVLAHLPLLFLILPVAVVFLGIVADPEETHAVWYGMLNTLGIFDISSLSDAENVNYVQKKHYFWFGEVGMAGILAGSIAVPAGIWFAGRTEITLAFIGAAVLFLPLFVFLPKLIQRGDEGGCGCCHRCVREERAGEESVLDFVHRR